VTEERVSSEPVQPSETGGPASDGEGRLPETTGAEAATPGPAAAGDATQRPRRRRRRRRRPSHLAGAGGGRPLGETAAAEATADVAPAESGAPPAEASEEGAPHRPVLRLRHLRRRHRPLRTAPRLGEASPGGEPAAGAPSEQPTAPGSHPLQARRRRRRPPFPPPALASAEPDAATDQEGAPAAPGDPATRPLGTRPPRSRNRRRRRPPSATPGAPGATEAAAAGEAGTAAPTEHRPERRDRPRRTRPPSSDGERGEGASERDRRDSGPPGRRDGRPGADRRDSQRDRGRGPPGRGGAPPGRGRGAPDRKIVRKLYFVDAVVDRGFDDIEEEAGTRRVHWTIVKRTTVDQVSRKALSAVYVLQRDGVDTEFPNLGAARSAVNKTIVHPEKLTRSKEEYAVEKNAKR